MFTGNKVPIYKKYVTAQVITGDSVICGAPKVWIHNNS